MFYLILLAYACLFLKKKINKFDEENLILSELKGHKFSIIEGYFHDKKYALNYKEDVKKKLSDFLKENIIYKNYLLRIREILINNQVISIHVRKGDYLTNINSSIYYDLDEKYYLNCLKKIKEKGIHNPFLLIFTNDINWVNNNLLPNLKEYNYSIISEKKNRDIIDLMLMSKCSINIIANSTYSLWAGILSNNDIVCYPRNWFVKNNPETNKMTLNHWIGL